MFLRARLARAGGALIAIAAAVNLAVAVVIALGDPRRATDLQLMYEWSRAWLIDAASLYTGPDAITDYPPNAIVLLAPIALLPVRWLVPIWIAVAVALTPLLPWLVLRAATPRHRDVRALVVPALLSLCWAAPRTLLQFTLLSMTLSGAALLAADTRWMTAGVAIGLGLMKPHIAGPVALWMLVSGRLRPLAVAAVVVAAGWGVYDARIGEYPLATAAGYWRVLGSQYAGADGLVGRTSLRGWTQAFGFAPRSADALWLGLTVLLLIVVCWLVARDRRRPLCDGGLAIVALFSLWSLLAVYHNGNNMILMLPAFAFLWFRGDRTPGRWISIAILQAVLMYDVPARLAASAPQGGWARAMVEHADRAAVLAAFIYVAIAWYRLTASPIGPAPAAAGAPRSPR